MKASRSATRLLVMSFEGQISPIVDLGCLNPDAAPADGWGIGLYGENEASARLHKEATPAQVPGRSQMLRNFEATSASVLVLHVREARWGNESLANTQPFVRTWAGREWLFAHAGSMRYPIETSMDNLFEAVGSTDSEMIFCELMSRIAARKWRNLGFADLQVLRDWFAEFNAHGTMNSVVTDGRDVCVFADFDEPLYLWELQPPHGNLVFGDEDLEVDLMSRGARGRRGVMFCSRPLTPRGQATATMRQVEPGSLVVVREGHVRCVLGPSGGESDATKTIIVRPRKVERPSAAVEQYFEVAHSTIYRYSTPVEHSTHLLRLTPIHDRVQEVLFHKIHCSVSGRVREYEDVFGNQVRRLLVQAPFDEMVIDARSVLRVRDTDPLRFRPIHARTTLPLVWMPWQRHMLSPYLLPPELPETQLLDLAEYAMSFARRNDHDLLETLIDINTTLHREYTYLQGSTNVFTTAYEVFESRRGVCQDFTNLFICIARLLGVPARYACGYIFTGPKNPNQIQSEASHAWAQVYLPEVGWKGFDPTNGVLTQTDHVRVAVGRNYVDATPTSGTIYVGGGGETLTVDVMVQPVTRERMIQLLGYDPREGHGSDRSAAEPDLVPVSAPTSSDGTAA